MQNPPRETIEDCQFHADDLKFTNWRDQKIGEVTQVLDPGVDESNECVVTYSADEVEVTAVNESENSSVTYPIAKIPRVDIELDVEVTGESKDLDAESTGVKVETGAYGREAYDAVPQDQGNKTKVYGLGQQVPKEGKEHKEMKHKTAMARVIMLLLNLMMLVTLTKTTKAGVTKALPTKKGGVNAEIAIENETLRWHEVTSKQNEHVFDTVPQVMAQETCASVYERMSERSGTDVRPCVSKHEEREVAVAATLSTRDRTMISDDFKDYLPSEAEGCNNKRVSKLRSETMRPWYDMQPTKQSQPQDMNWRLSWSHCRAVIIGTGRIVNDDSLGTCGGPKKYKHSNEGVIDGTNADERILGADKKILVGSEIPGVSLGYDGILEIKVVAGCTISGQSVDKDVDDWRKLQLTQASG